MAERSNEERNPCKKRAEGHTEQRSAKARKRLATARRGREGSRKGIQGLAWRSIRDGNGEVKGIATTRGEMVPDSEGKMGEGSEEEGDGGRE
jgi:hypothetical protein